MGLYHSTYRPETATLRAIFIAPTKLKNRFPLPFIGRHSLSFAAFSSSLREGAGNTIHPVTPEAQKFFTLCRKERQAW